MSSCERPLNRSASDTVPSSVSKRYSLSIRTQGSSCRRRASSSLRRVSSFSASSSSSRAASHSSRVPVRCFVIALLSFSCHYIGVVSPPIGAETASLLHRAHDLPCPGRDHEQSRETDHPRRLAGQAFHRDGERRERDRR